MVLEHIFPERWLAMKWFFAFALGIIYSIIGIALAALLFPSDPALVSVAFISLLMLPELSRLFSIEERREDREMRFSFKRLLVDNRHFILLYLSLFLGILLVYSLATVFLPSFHTNTLFREQLEMRGNVGDAVELSGEPSAIHATAVHGSFDWEFLLSILINNAAVIIACFLISFLTGDGAIFLITWNASVWGTIFGLTARNAAMLGKESALVYFAFILLIVLPHVILEGGAYIIAAISGGVISKGVLLEKFVSKDFNRVFFYNFWLFLFALLVLVIGGFVETFVVMNVPLYPQIIQQSLLMG
ncbi:MAG: stage II sporulation protein M [archaeon]